MTKNKTYLVAMMASLVGLSGCGSFSVDEYLPDKKVEYEKSEEVGRDLEIPPDLTNVRVGSELYVPGTNASGSTTYSEFLGEKKIAQQAGGNVVGSSVLPKIENIELKRDGDQRWLVINSSPQLVWPGVVGFWQENGILLVEQDPTVGIMKTGWLENRADIESDFITNSIRKVFDGIYSAATRDQYRVRLEEGSADGSTEIFLTHFGMEEILRTDSTADAGRSMWRPRGSDPTLEAEMLRRLMIHLGVQEQRADSLVAQKAQQKQQRSQLLINSNESKLLVSENFAKTWRLTGLALDRVGFAVEDRDRSQGIYYVRYNDPMASVESDEGWLSGLKFWNSDTVDEDQKFQISINPVPSRNASEIEVLDEAGRKLKTETAGRILTLVHEQIR